MHCLFIGPATVFESEKQSTKKSGCAGNERKSNVCSTNGKKEEPCNKGSDIASSIVDSILMSSLFPSGPSKENLRPSEVPSTSVPREAKTSSSSVSPNLPTILNAILDGHKFKHNSNGSSLHKIPQRNDLFPNSGTNPVHISSESKTQGTKHNHQQEHLDSIKSKLEAAKSAFKEMEGIRKRRRENQQNQKASTKTTNPIIIDIGINDVHTDTPCLRTD